jgi:hypothetical protein
MDHQPRIESGRIAMFQTTRSQNSELWFVNSSWLGKAILGYAAKYATRHRAKLYALAIEGNHTHFRAIVLPDLAKAIEKFMSTLRDGY